MKKYLFAFMALYAFNFIAKPATADMPYYKDDAEFKRCVKVNIDWDVCTHEQTVRALNRVKQNYRSILRSNAVYKWHEKLEDSTILLRDMYDSWLAFRNRLCSLSNKAAQKMNKPHSEKEACILYYTLHHDDHIESILKLVSKNVPAKSSDFKFLELTTNDDEYDDCIDKGKISKNECIAEEVKRSSQEIKDLYKTFIADENVGKWNNGPSLKEGNYRDMYDSWVAYRNRLCSLAIYASKYAYGKDAITLEQCLQYFNREKLETMENLLRHAQMSPQTEDEETDEETDANAKAKQKPVDETLNDGGEAEGKTIEPLKRHISSGSNNGEDSLVGLVYEKKAEAPDEPKTEANPKRNIPNWARQK